MFGKIAFVYAIAVAAGIWGFAIGRYEVFPFPQIAPSLIEISEFLRGHPEEDPTSFIEKVVYHPQEQKSHFSYSGFHVRDTEFVDPGYLLTTRFDKTAGQTIVELIQLDGFKKLHTWTPPIAEIIERAKKGGRNNEKATGSNDFTTGHPLLLRDGSIVFNSGHGSLVKLGACNQIVWLNDGHFHHSIELNHEGDIVAVFSNTPKIAAYPKSFRDDGFAVIRPDGTIARRYSVAKILAENDQLGLLLGIGRREENIIHLNDAQPILRNLRGSRIGDIALSIRHLSTVMLYRPASNKIIWLQTGPWLNQHDVNQLEDGRFSVFSNNIYRTSEGNEFMPPGTNQIHVWDPETRGLWTPYSKVLTALSIKSATAGRSKILKNGDVFIEESRRDRIIRASATKARWEFVNGVTETTTGAFNWARYLSKADLPDEFWKRHACN